MGEIHELSFWPFLLAWFAGANSWFGQNEGIALQTSRGRNGRCQIAILFKGRFSSAENLQWPLDGSRHSSDQNPKARTFQKLELLFQKLELLTPETFGWEWKSSRSANSRGVEFLRFYSVWIFVTPPQKLPSLLGTEIQIFGNFGGSSVAEGTCAHGIRHFRLWLLKTAKNPLHFRTRTNLSCCAGPHSFGSFPGLYLGPFFEISFEALSGPVWDTPHTAQYLFEIVSQRGFRSHFAFFSCGIAQVSLRYPLSVCLAPNWPCWDTKNPMAAQ